MLKRNNADYDSEPVLYCPRCLSLKIEHEDITDTDFCGNCGCTDTAETTIDLWEIRYVNKYGHKFAEKSNDPKKSPVYQMTLLQLKQKMVNSEAWKTVIKKMYPHFPEGMSRIDSILLFFDKLLVENRLDEFKLLLIEMKI